MVVFLLVSGVQLVMIGVLGEYLLRAMAVVRRRPPYLIERVVGGERPPADRPRVADGAERVDSAT
jgi:dolichol-phosphate mannosyltransferase